MSNKYEIVINEFSGLTGHTNMSMYANGELLGTYGSNLGDPDFNIFNGLSGGVYVEALEDRPSSPINRTTYSLSQEKFETLHSEVLDQVYQTSIGNSSYFAVGQNCVDRVDNWLDSAGVDHDLSNMFIGETLSTYALVREEITDLADWLQVVLNPSRGWSESLHENVLEFCDDFESTVEKLGGSELADEFKDLCMDIANTQYSPIAIDLDDDGLETNYFHSESVFFDINGDGNIDRTAWLSPDDGFLAFDLNNDGLINNGDELFGGNDRGEGYEKLSNFDSNNDGYISDADEGFDQLLIWQDKNSDGYSDIGEISSLTDFGIDKISVIYESRDEYDHGNLIGEHSLASMNGNQVAVGDIYFTADLEVA